MPIFLDDEKSLNETFTSTIYLSVDEYLLDCLFRTVDEFRTRNGTLRTPQDTARILSKKQQASIRLEKHDREGGTQLEFVPSFKLERPLKNIH